MKNKILSFALCLCLLIGLFAGTLVPACAESNSDDWNWILSGNDVVLVGYRGTETDLIIPSVIEGHRVTTLQESLLKGKCDITSVTIPASVTLIQHFAFRDCGNLTAVYYEGTLEQWCNISFGESYSNPLTCAHHLYIQGEKFTQFTLPDNSN